MDVRAFWLFCLAFIGLLFFMDSFVMDEGEESTSSPYLPDSNFTSVLTAGDREVLFRKGLKETLRHAYKSQNSEFPFCLHGRNEGDTLFVESLMVPDVKMSGGSFGSFDNANCSLSPLEYLGVVHNHPTGMCYPSDIDFNRFRSSTFAVLEVVACRNPSHDVFFYAVSKLPK